VVQLEVHVFFSAAGGTGSGCAMDVLGYLEKICLRKPGSVLLPYAFFTGESPQEQRLAAELIEWLDWADEDLVPHCYLSDAGSPLPQQVETVARALVCGQQFFYIGGEYYDHLYDSIRPRGTAPGDRFASLGYASGPVDDWAWLKQIRSQVTVTGEGKGPRSVLLLAFPRELEDTLRLECQVEDELVDALPFRLNDTVYCSMAPGSEAQALLLQSGLGAARCEVLSRLAGKPPVQDYFAARDDRD
jgi:hypothetical protein